MGALLQLVPAVHPRHCIDCGHTHGVLRFGLCWEEDESGEICECVQLRTGRPQMYSKDGPVCARTLVRRAKRRFEQMNAEERARYERWVRRWLDSDFSMKDFAAAAGLDLKLLWRTWRSLHPTPANGGGKFGE